MNKPRHDLKHLKNCKNCTNPMKLKKDSKRIREVTCILGNFFHRRNSQRVERQMLIRVDPRARYLIILLISN